mmetsp:Transcript_151934/g.487642  ORF Transcript_151934/g.487642 Transcript_151934/m.487642 type:complete len:161 (-) Transcript_151934:87-569(-)
MHRPGLRFPTAVLWLTAVAGPRLLRHLWFPAKLVVALGGPPGIEVETLEMSIVFSLPPSRKDLAALTSNLPVQLPTSALASYDNSSRTPTRVVQRVWTVQQDRLSMRFLLERQWCQGAIAECSWHVALLHDCLLHCSPVLSLRWGCGQWERCFQFVVRLA